MAENDDRREDAGHEPRPMDRAIESAADAAPLHEPHRTPSPLPPSGTTSRRLRVPPQDPSLAMAALQQIASRRGASSTPSDLPGRAAGTFVSRDRPTRPTIADHAANDAYDALITGRRFDIADTALRLIADPDERVNLACDSAGTAQVARMRAQMLDLRMTRADRRLTGHQFGA